MYPAFQFGRCLLTENRFYVFIYLVGLCVHVPEL
jgi:hypothetical protein